MNLQYMPWCGYRLFEGTKIKHLIIALTVA